MHWVKTSCNMKQYNIMRCCSISLMDSTFFFLVLKHCYLFSQVVVGRFVAGQEESQQQQQQMKTQRRERFGIPTSTQASNISFGGGSAEDPKARYGLNKPVVIQAPPMSAPPVPFSQHEPQPSTNAVQGYYTNNTAEQIRDLFSSLPGEDDDDLEGEDGDDGEFGDHSESDTEVPS